MTPPHTDAPPPDLRIVLTRNLHPHEEHDSQRAQPLISRLSQETVVINPPVVAPMSESGQFVVLDGANRYYAFSHLAYPHILVQVAPYDSGYVELDTWRHLICAWNETSLLEHLRRIESVEMLEGQHHDAIAHILFRDERLLALRVPVHSTHERNAALREIVRIYQQNAVLQRTALSEPEDIWRLHPDALAMVIFPHYAPTDIIAAAHHLAYLPPGISRHIIHGRALRINYPLDLLRAPDQSLDAKNAHLQAWMQEKLARRQIRYYAEATYQFDE